MTIPTMTTEVADKPADTTVPDDSEAVEPANDVPVSEAKIAWHKFNNVKLAQGYNVLGAARGSLVMSNIFLSSAFIFLASEQAGCLNEEGDEVLDDCDGEVYGFKPASFVSSIAVIAGVLSALFMPMFGAMVDYTSHRRTVGVVAAILMMMIQAVQIGTVSSTWFAMTILQALAGFFYQVEVLATYAYLPDIARAVGQEIMTGYSAIFVMVQFGAQSSFLIVVIAVGIAAGLDDVATAQVGQAINTVWSSVAFFIGWRLLPNMPARRVVPEGHSLLAEGFRQIFRTAKHINKEYNHGLKWFLLAVIFAEAAANAFTVVAVIFLDEQVGLSATEIGIFFLTTLICSLPGSLMASHITKRLDPNKSWQLSMVFLVLWAGGGVFIVDASTKYVAYLWSVGIGLGLGWFYPTENLFFSMCLPVGQEAELAGFFVYCTQILGWLPPLIFTGMVEADVSQTYAVPAILVFFLIAICLLRCASSWEDILLESGRLESHEDENEDTNASKPVGYGLPKTTMTTGM